MSEHQHPAGEKAATAAEHERAANAHHRIAEGIRQRMLADKRSGKHPDMKKHPAYRAFMAHADATSAHRNAAEILRVKANPFHGYRTGSHEEIQARSSRSARASSAHANRWEEVKHPRDFHGHWRHK